MRQLATLLLILATAACASGSRADTVPVAEAHPALDRQLAYTHTHEIRFGTSDRVHGYLVEYLRLPEGLELEREFPQGTVLLQDTEFRTFGVITPGLEGLTFDKEGNPRTLGRGGRDQLVMAIFGRTERPSYTSILPGVPVLD
jgi:hypothetical protein